jgi:O-antigen ligase
VQEYDGMRNGRFERHAIGFLWAMEHPLGIGPLEFGQILGEDTHNIWLKALMDYGWIGFVSYLILITWTLVLGFRYMLRDRPWQAYAMMVWIALLGHTMIGTVIDTDHWRHFYLLMGMSWGAIALEQRWQMRLRAERGGAVRGTSGTARV